MNRARPHIRQAVTITGLGGERFSEAINTVENLVVLFMNRFPADTMDPWQRSAYKDYPALDATTRYFTNTRIAGSTEQVPFDALTDPEGVLADMVNEDFVHTVNNDVQYYGRTKNADNTYT